MRLRPWWCLVSVAALHAASCGSEPHTRVVTIRNLRYGPDTVRVQVGDTVRWVNEDIVPHTITTASKGWDSGTIGAAQSWQVEATTAGSSEYYCELHPTMRGVVVTR